MSRLVKYCDSRHPYGADNDRFMGPYLVAGFVCGSLQVLFISFSWEACELGIFCLCYRSDIEAQKGKVEETSK